MNDTLTHVAFDLLDGAGVGRWTLDGSTSSLTIRQRALWGLTGVRGGFTKITGDGEILADGTAVGTLRVAAESVRTGAKRRDARLRSARFLAAADHPQITFWLTNVRLSGERDIRVDGELEVRGVLEPITFRATIDDATTEAVTVSGEAHLDRRAFGMARRTLAGRTAVRFAVRFTRR